MKTWFGFYIVSTLINLVLSYKLGKDYSVEDTLLYKKDKAERLIWLVSYIVSISFLVYLVGTSSNTVLIYLAVGQLYLLVYRYFKMTPIPSWYFPVYGTETIMLVAYLIVLLFRPYG